MLPRSFTQVVPTPQLRLPFSIPWQPKKAAFYSSFPHIKDQLACFYCPMQEEILKVSLKCSLSRNYFLVFLAIPLSFPPIKSSHDSLLLRWLKLISGSNKCLESISDIKCRFLVNRVTGLFFPPHFKEPCQDDSQEQIWLTRTQSPKSMGCEHLSSPHISGDENKFLKSNNLLRSMAYEVRLLSKLVTAWQDSNKWKACRQDTHVPI